MRNINSIRCEVRGFSLFGRAGREAYRGLQRNQPLLLVREPGNPADPRAIRLDELIGTPVGYVAREIAATVAPLIDAGELWLGKVLSPGRGGGQRYTVALLWREREEQVAVTDTGKSATVTYDRAGKPSWAKT